MRQLIDPLQCGVLFLEKQRCYLLGRDWVTSRAITFGWKSSCLEGMLVEVIWRTREQYDSQMPLLMEDVAFQECLESDRKLIGSRDSSFIFFATQLLEKIAVCYIFGFYVYLCVPLVSWQMHLFSSETF